MPLITVIAPGTAVEVEGMALPGAVVERVRLATGANPLLYDLAWRETPAGPARRATFRGDKVTEAEPAAPPAAPARGGLADLGRQFAARLGETP